MMKKLPFSKKQIDDISKKYPTPFYFYDEQGIREGVRALIQAFSWAPHFTEYFAVKACPNPYILEILKEEGCGADCSSLGELVLAEAVGIQGDKVMFTSNNTPAHEFQKAYDMGAIINFDDKTHIPFFEKYVGSQIKKACCRYNPGALKEGNAIIGSPEEAKYGMTREDLFEAYRRLKEQGGEAFGLHTMVASNELNPDYFAETARIVFDMAREIENEIGISFSFINLGGGIGIPYRPEEKPVDLARISTGIQKEYEKHFQGDNMPNIALELGRYITGPHGYLITKAIHEKNIYKNYVGVDACMADIMRPGMYGAYHHITILGKEEEANTHQYDVVGSLCENNDKFAINRMLPKIETGDTLIIHDAGAHGHAMGFNYNAKLRPAELLLKLDGSVQQIRRAQTLNDYFSTLDYPGLTR